MFDKRQKFIIEVEAEVEIDLFNISNQLRAMKGVVGVCEYENPLEDVLRDVGGRIWKLEGRGDLELSGIRGDIEQALNVDLRKFPKQIGRK